MSVSKYNVTKDTKKRTYNGILFDSEMEMRFYRDWIVPKMESGDITDCELQVSYELQQKFIRDGKTILPVIYVADFVVTEKSGHTIVFDVKGMPDSVALLKRKMFWFKYPDIDYRWICESKIDGGWVPYDYVKKQRAKRKRDKNKK